MDRRKLINSIELLFSQYKFMRRSMYICVMGMAIATVWAFIVHWEATGSGQAAAIASIMGLVGVFAKFYSDDRDREK